MDVNDENRHILRDTSRLSPNRGGAQGAGFLSWTERIFSNTKYGVPLKQTLYKVRISISNGGGHKGGVRLTNEAAVSILMKQPQDDEKSLCASELSGDFSLDNPSYGSIILQIQEANVEADGTCDFIWKAFEIIGNTLLITVLLGIFMALPVAMISVGVKYLHECPREPKIPIYLLVGGCFGLLKLLSLLWKQVKSRRYERLDEIYDTEEDGASGLTSKSSTFTDVVLSLFLFIWFVFGNYWVISVWEPNYKQLLYEPSNWCDKTVYLFAFSQIMACYCLMVLIAFCICILTLCHRYTVMFEKS